MNDPLAKKQPANIQNNTMAKVLETGVDIRFRLYNQFESSVFDLIRGERRAWHPGSDLKPTRTPGELEPEQTKGLGLLLAKDQDFLTTFLGIKKVRAHIENRLPLAQYSKIVIHSELISSGGKRIDIAILFYKDNKPDTCVIIEAKSINKGACTSAANQVEEYGTALNFESLQEFSHKFLFVLTKNEIVLGRKDVATLLWDDIVRALKGLNPAKGSLAYDYLYFLTNIKGSMKFYEKEVYSIPAGTSFKSIENDPCVYECPNSGVYLIKRTPLYLAFRQGDGGVMNQLYGLDRLIVLNPKQDLAAFNASEAYDVEIKNRISVYCRETWPDGILPDKEKQFFILSKKNRIPLNHEPRPKRNNPFRAYYALAELLSGKKIVEIDK